MLDFRNPDGTIKKNLYKFVSKHQDDPEVLKILSNPGATLKEKYMQYLSGNSMETSLSGNEVSQTFNYESGESSSSKILDVSKSLTEEELLKQHGYDVEKWKIVKHQCSKWDSGDTTLMASKIFVKPRNILEGSPGNILKTFNKALNLKPLDWKNRKVQNSEKLLVLPISDLHYGLLSDSFTSDNVYNMKIAEDRIWEYISTTLENTKLSSKDEILITFGNDFFNCDNVHGTTVHDTPQDNEASYLTVWDKGVRLGISVIDTLLKLTPCSKITVANVQGNHDLQSSHAMLVALYYKYSKEERVFVNYESDEKSRFYFRFGNNLLGFGHETKIKECHRIMSSECRDWSDYSYRTMFLGHLHSEEVLDTGALVIRRLPVLSGKSIWTDSKGYMSHPRAQAFVFDRNKGLVNTINVEIEEQEEEE